MKGFGIFLIIVAVACGIGAYTQNQETELERINQRVIDTNEDALRKYKALEGLAAVAGLSARVEAGSRDSRDSISRASADADRYKSERNQRMLLWLGGAAVCFIAGIICITSAKKPIAALAPTS